MFSLCTDTPDAIAKDLIAAGLIDGRNMVVSKYECMCIHVGIMYVGELEGWWLVHKLTSRGRDGL